MGYFPNGTSGEFYQAEYCDRCVHQGDPDGPGCAVWFAHLLHNYRDCNDEDSILHMLIPRSKDPVIGNEQCLMFHEGEG